MDHEIEGYVTGDAVRIIAVHCDSGRHVGSLRQFCIEPPLVELRHAGPGFGWRDKEGHLWERSDLHGWQHSYECICRS